MSILIQNAGSSNQPDARFLPADFFEDVMSSFKLGSTLARTRPNAIGGNAVTVGNPAINSRNAAVSASAYLQTDVVETADMTMWCLFKQPVTGAIILMGNRTGLGADGGSNLQMNSSGVVSILGGAGSTSSVATRTGTPQSQYKLAIATVKTVGATVETLMDLYNPTLSTSAVSSSANARNIAVGRPFRIGGDYSLDVTGSVDMSYVGNLDRALDGTERAALAAIIIANANARGIVLGATS